MEDRIQIKAGDKCKYCHDGKLILDSLGWLICDKCRKWPVGGELPSAPPPGWERVRNSAPDNSL